MIKALLFKDINALKRYARLLLVMAVVCSFLFKDQGSALIVMIYSASLMLTTMAIDEREHFLRRAISDSGRKKEIVGEKYILLLMLVGIAGVLSVILEYIMALFYHRPLAWDGVAMEILTGFAITSFSGSTTIPLTLKFGSEKARIILLLCYMVPAVFAIWLFSSIDITLFLPLIIIAAVLFSVLCNIVSFLISLRLLAKKDFESKRFA